MFDSKKAEDLKLELGTWHQFNDTSTIIFTCPECGRVIIFDAADVYHQSDNKYSIHLKCDICKFFGRVILKGWRK